MLRTLSVSFAALALIWNLAGWAAVEAPQQPGTKLDARAVERWADEAFGRILAEHRVSALAISVTQGNSVIFKKGYGFADWATRTPVDPDTSQFRIASLSKTFVGTAIAQLYERGKIASLDDPVNKYLKRVQLKSFGGKQPTIWDMMTHQGGLGTSPVFVPNETEPLPVPPLPAEYIQSKMPDVVREPGTISIYCNPCTATLGFMIEDITGQTLQAYLKQNVFDPLGMTHSAVVTEHNPPSKDIVVQYAFVPGAAPRALPYPNITPFLAYAGAINSTAGDMAKYLITHIQQSPKLMKPATYKLMHARHRGNAPDTSGFGMQFFVYDYNGEHVLEHYGSLNFRSMEFLMLNRKIGVFVTFAGGGPAQANTAAPSGTPLPSIEGEVLPAMSHSGVRALVLEHFLGKLPVRKDMKVNVAQYTATYRSIPARADDRGQGRGLEVKDSGDGGLTIGDLGVFRPSGPDAFTLDGTLPLQSGFGVSNRYVFVRGSNGTMRMFGHINAGGYERAPQ